MTAVLDICTRAAAVAPELARLSTAVKDAALHAMAEALEKRAGDIVEANAEDVSRAESEGTSGALVDRLRLTDSRLAAMAHGLRAIAAQPDPVGEVVTGWSRPNGIWKA